MRNMNRRGNWGRGSEGMSLRRGSTAAPAAAALPPLDDRLPPIPELREKEKEERKGAALPWYTGAGPGAGGLYGTGTTVQVGTSLAVRTDLIGRIAAALSRVLGGPASSLGRLFAGAAGRLLVGSLLAAGALLIIAAAIRYFSRPAQESSAEAPAFVPPVSSKVRIPARADLSLRYLAAANKKEIPDPYAHAPRTPAPEPELPAETAPEPEAARPEAVVPAAPAPRETLRPLGWGRTREGFAMSAGAGRFQPSAIGSFGAPGGLDAAALRRLGASGGAAPKGSGRGRLSAVRRANRALTSHRLGNLKGNSSRAMGQLKLANALSMLGAMAESDQAARSMASDAFDQRKTVGGALAGVPDGSGIVSPLGSGAPEAGLTPGAPDLPPGANLTPYQGQVDNARGLGEQAAALKNAGMMMLMMGGMLLMIGIALMAAGAAMMAAPPPMNLIGIALLAAGAALAAAGAGLISEGMNMLQQAQQMAQQAKNQGNGIADQYGQPEQGAIVGQCAQQSADTGMPVDACAARNPAGNQQNHANVREAVQAEANAGFTLTPGAGGGAGQ